MPNPYNQKRTNNLFNPQSKEQFNLSRSKIDLFLECPRCFYLEKRLGALRPKGLPFTLNVAVDHLLKKEFDLHRAENKTHPLMEHYKINAIPFSHPDLDIWRNNFKGIRYLHKPTNLEISGAVDDIWQGEDKKLIIVDYKATAKDGNLSLDNEWQDSWKRQMEIYQWLFRQNNFEVSKTGYFVYCNGRKDKEAFDGRLEFDIEIIPYTGDDSWIEGKLLEIKKVLESDVIPEASSECKYCNYRKEANKSESK